MHAVVTLCVYACISIGHNGSLRSADEPASPGFQSRAFKHPPIADTGDLAL